MQSKQKLVTSFICFLLFLFVGNSMAEVQCLPLYTFTGEAAYDNFGWPVFGAGDVNNDGFDDLIVGAGLNDEGGNDAGKVYIYSGYDGDTLCTFIGEAPGDYFGSYLSDAGDVNNDGYDDIIVGAYGNDAAGDKAGKAYVFSGYDCDTLCTFIGEAAGDHFGHTLSGAGDVNGDGFDDLIVEAHMNDEGGSNAGKVYVFSGYDCDTLYTFIGEAAEDNFGIIVSGAGDVNNDGYDDFIIGACWNDEGGNDAGKVYVFSGYDGDTLYTFIGEAAGDIFGAPVSGAGDVNNDGYDEVIVGAFKNDEGGNDAGKVYVFSGYDGDTLYTFIGEEAGDSFGARASDAGDVNNDGFDDLIVGARGNDEGGSNAGKAYVFSGYDGDTLDTFIGEAAGDWFGDGVSGAGDVNNDGIADLIVGAALNDAGGTNAGRAYVYACTQECNNILVYATADSPPYSHTSFLDLVDVLYDWNVTVEDRTTLPLVTAEILSDYDQFWLMSSELEYIEQFSQQEVTDRLDFRESGGGLVIAADDEYVHNYQDDANQISIPLGVEFSGTVSHGPSDCFIPSPTGHPVVSQIDELYGTTNEGGMIVQIPNTIEATAGSDPIVVVRDDGLGRVVYDASFVRFMNPAIHVCDDSIYVNNIANWLQNCGGPSSVIEPNPIYAFMRHTYQDVLKAVIYMGSGIGNGGHTVSEIDDATILVNNITPELIEIIPTHPEFIGEIMKITINMADFIDSYPLLWDTDTNTYTVTGDFLLGDSFTHIGDVVLVGHTSGDPNFDQVVNVLDISYLISYLYLGGPSPRPFPEIGDTDGDGVINVFDITRLISYLYLGGLPPIHP